MAAARLCVVRSERGLAMRVLDGCTLEVHAAQQSRQGIGAPLGEPAGDEAGRSEREQLRGSRTFARLLELCHALIHHVCELTEVLCVSVGDELEFGSCDLESNRVFHTYRSIRAERIESSRRERVTLEIRACSCCALE